MFGLHGLLWDFLVDPLHLLDEFVLLALWMGNQFTWTPNWNTIAKNNLWKPQFVATRVSQIKLVGGWIIEETNIYIYILLVYLIKLKIRYIINIVLCQANKQTKFHPQSGSYPAFSNIDMTCGLVVKSFHWSINSCGTLSEPEDVGVIIRRRRLSTALGDSCFGGKMGMVVWGTYPSKPVTGATGASVSARSCDAASGTSGCDSGGGDRSEGCVPPGKNSGLVGKPSWDSWVGMVEG